MNACTSCNRDFSSIRAFDAHRVGKHEYTRERGLAMNPPLEDGRRCLREDELSAAEFGQNTRGGWGLINQMEPARQRFSAQPSAAKRKRQAA